MNGVFGKYASQYLEKGYAPIPVNGKSPVIKGWPDLTIEDIKHQLPNWKKKYRNLGIGILTGKNFGLEAFDCDLDTNIPEHRELLEEIEDLLPTPSPVTKIGRKGFTGFYGSNGNHSASVSNGRFQVFDLLSDRKQVVLPPSIHPDTNKPFRWKGVSLLDIEIRDLPKIEQTNLQALISRISQKKIGSYDDLPKTSGRNNKLKEMAILALKRGDDPFLVASDLFYFDKIAHNPPLFSDMSESQMVSRTPEENSIKFVESIRQSLIKIGKIDKQISKRHPACFEVAKEELVLSEDAYHGLSGEFLKLIEPHTEASMPGLLIQFLTCIGNVVGRNCYFKVEGDTHYTNIFSVIVGKTSKGRKGTSWGRVRELMELVDPKWAKNQIKSGLSSAEGLLTEFIEKKEEYLDEPQF